MISSAVKMKRNSNTVVFLALLVAQWHYSSTLDETSNPLDCSTSNVSSCDAFIYLRDITEPIDVVASRFNISAQNISMFRGADYLARIRCSCLSFLGKTAFFYRVNYTAQPADSGLGVSQFSDKYFSYTAWTERQFNASKAGGDQVQLALVCGCPILGWHYIISYAVPPTGTLSTTTQKFDSDQTTIINLNNISNPDLIMMNRVYFIPYQKGGALLLLLWLALILYYVFWKTISSPASASTTMDKGPSEYWVARLSEMITGKGTEQEERDEIHNGLSLCAITNLTADEILQMKSFCCQSYLIGEGSFGRVYRGKLKGKDVAIKRIERRGRDSRKFIENEVKLLQGMEHKNLIALVAWYIGEHIFDLAYEYVDGCTLHDYLRERCPGVSLKWKDCLRIIVDIAKGIEFLHSNKIIHVDIKPQNLMLDSKDNDVKIIDFGLSRHVDWEGTHCSTDRIAGTRGYWAPEYCFNHRLSYKHDVYSFGIVVLEVITGQMHVDNARGSSQFHIPQYIKHMMARNRFEEAVDERLKEGGWDDCDLRNAMAVAELALRCADMEKDERPDMDYVVKALNSLTNDSNEQQDCCCVVN